VLTNQTLRAPPPLLARPAPPNRPGRVLCSTDLNPTNLTRSFQQPNFHTELQHRFSAVDHSSSALPSIALYPNPLTSSPHLGLSSANPATRVIDDNMDSTGQTPPPPLAPPAAPATPDAPDQETMEQIRRRRLAKLGGPPSSASSTASPNPEETEPSATSKPLDKGKEKAISMPEPRSKINISPAPQPGLGAGSVIASRKRPATEIDSVSATQPPRRQTPLKEESIEDYADRILSTIFRVTVDQDRQNLIGQQLTFLPNLSRELAEEGAPLKLSIERLEEAIMEAATAYPHSSPLFEYFLPCWKRVTKAIRVLRGPAPQKEEILREARRLCFSNCIFALTMPELFR